MNLTPYSSGTDGARNAAGVVIPDRHQAPLQIKVIVRRAVAVFLIDQLPGVIVEAVDHARSVDLLDAPAIRIVSVAAFLPDHVAQSVAVAHST